MNYEFLAFLSIFVVTFYAGGADRIDQILVMLRALQELLNSVKITDIAGGATGVR